ncbi:MAG: hypothetical protein WBZ35_18600, partial [Pseudolabrys sp.]
LAQRLGLLLLGAMGLFLYFVAIAYNKPVICFVNCKTDALNSAPCSLWQIAAASFGESVAGAII